MDLNESRTASNEAQDRIEEWKEAFAQMIAKGFKMLSKDDGDDVMVRVHQIFPPIQFKDCTSLVWTRKKPAIPGTYWIWTKKYGFPQLCLAMKTRSGDSLFLTTMGGAMIKMPVTGDELFEGQWLCGPIDEPGMPPLE